ncbi:hypothetical protein IB279_13670 [Ensifer sp. ENS06]|uniref:hypothetical protein n=1 Tax=Ensifer sp. ENS06 TaxID=2769276 RepID=UPI0017804F7D|nr:hypothetical protein [Ensifer sp. ENS06]MBD9623991.1 hypothetical protein [Ensifer sp. ENS06]
MDNEEENRKLEDLRLNAVALLELRSRGFQFENDLGHLENASAYLVWAVSPIAESLLRFGASEARRLRVNQFKGDCPHDRLGRCRHAQLALRRS